jgi:hypothetical protein
MIVDWSRAIVLTAAAFQAWWEVLRLGETPWQLDPPRAGSTAAARKAFVADALAQQQGAGPDLVRQLPVLARPAWSLDVRLRSDGLVAGLAACRAAEGVLAVRCGEDIALAWVAPQNAAAAVLSLLGPVCPGPGRPMLVTSAHSAPPPVVAACRDVRMFGQLGASVATPDGLRMRRMPRVIGFHRTGAGDYRSVRVDRSTIALEPATSARLAADLDELLPGTRG